MEKSTQIFTIIKYQKRPLIPKYQNTIENLSMHLLIGNFDQFRC